MDLISALRFDQELREWHNTMTPEEWKAKFGRYDDSLIDKDL